MIKIDDFAKCEIQVGEIVTAIAVEGSDKLIREEVDFGEEKRIIFSGIKKWYMAEELVGNKYLYITNLEPRKMPSFTKNADGEKIQEYSQGMVLAVDDPSGKPVLVEMPKEVANGARVR